MIANKIEKDFKLHERERKKHQSKLNSISDEIYKEYGVVLDSCSNLADLDRAWEEIKQSIPKSHKLIEQFYSSKRGDILKLSRIINYVIRPEANHGPWGGKMDKEIVVMVDKDSLVTKPGWAVNNWGHKNCNLVFFDKKGIAKYKKYCKNEKDNSKYTWYSEFYKKIIHPSQEEIEKHFNKWTTNN